MTTPLKPRPRSGASNGDRKDPIRAAQGRGSAEIGSTGLKRFGGSVQEEFEPTLQGKRGVEVFEEMRRNDPDAGALIFALTHMALQAEWSVEAASEEQADVDAKEFLETVMEDMSHTWRDFIIDAMTSNIYGWAYFEIVFKQRLGPTGDPGSRNDDGRVGIRKIAIRGQESLDEWQFGKDGGLEGMWQSAAPEFKRVFLPIEKCLLVRTSREKNNPEGYSLLRNAYRPYYLKKNLEEIEVIGAERDMTGVLVITLPANATDEDFDTAREIGERYKVDDQAYILLQNHGPEAHENWHVDTVKSPGAKVVNVGEAITRNSVLMARSILAQFLTLGQGQVGSYALSSTHMDLFHLAVKGRLDTFQDELNAFLVPKVFQLNEFPGRSQLPKIVHSDLGDIDLATLAQFLTAANGAGLLDVTPEVIEHIHKRAGLPAPSADLLDEPPEVIDDEVTDEDEEDLDFDAVAARAPKTMREWGRRYLR